MSIFVILLILVLSPVTISACGCYGQGTCTVGGAQVTGFSDPNIRCTGVCDCCPACNGCAQLMAGCLAERVTQNPVEFVPLLSTSPFYNAGRGGNSLTLVIGQDMGIFTLTPAPGWPNTIFFEACVNPILPRGITIGSNPSGTFVLSGTPTETLPLTLYTVILKGGLDFLGSANFTLQVTPETVCNNNNNNSCIVGSQQCIDATHYHTCIQAANNQGIWLSINQPCPPGTSCHTSSPTSILCF